MRKRNNFRNGNGNGNGHGFNLATVVQILAIPLFTAIIGLVGWYFLTNATVQQNTKDINSLQANRDMDKKEFATKFDTMNDSLAKLNTHAAVQDQQNQQMNDTLKQIRDALAPIPHR